MDCEILQQRRALCRFVPKYAGRLVGGNCGTFGSKIPSDPGYGDFWDAYPLSSVILVSMPWTT